VQCSLRACCYHAVAPVGWLVVALCVPVHAALDHQWYMLCLSQTPNPKCVVRHRL
jgi:hypothetical protein